VETSMDFVREGKDAKKKCRKTVKILYSICSHLP
jgi:hypothetical protein